MAFSAPVASAPSAGPANIGRGVAGTAVQVKVAFERPPGLAMVENVGAARDALGDVVENITLGNVEVPPLPRGEPGGRVIGKGKDIRGVFRFTRIRHSLSDWWADASSLNALTKWLNERTKIKTDMNVEGGALKLTDANLFKTPFVFMTGHDPSLVRSRNLLGRQYGGGKMDSRLTETEAAGMRRYLVERGGFLVFDDCGVNAPAQAMIRLFLAQMRYVMLSIRLNGLPTITKSMITSMKWADPQSASTSSGGAHVHRNGTTSKVSPSVKSCPLSLSVVTTCAQWSLSVSRHVVSTIHPVSIVS